jgi:heme-degrading monooxygenase HmoA
MYMTIREYKVSPQQADEVIRRVDTNWVEQLRKVKGFVSYHVVRPDPDRLVAIAGFLDQGSARMGAEASAEWVGQRLLLDLDVEFIGMREGPVVVHEGP